MTEVEIEPSNSLQLISNSSATASSAKKRRFNLGAYQRMKKQVIQSELLKKTENEQKINEIKLELGKQEAELKEVSRKLHSTQALISKRKRKIDELKENIPVSGTTDYSKNVQTPRKPSRISQSSSEKLNISRSQQGRRKHKTVEAMKTIHCVTNRKSNESLISVNDGLWTTLVGTATKSELTTYITQSKLCMGGILPGIIKDKCKNYTTSQSNQIRSMRVLYERGLIGKRKYTSIRNSSYIVIKTGNKRKNKKAEIIPGCEIPKILPYKTVMNVIRSINIGEVLDLENLATQLSVKSVPGVYRPLKSFLLRLADLYLMVHEENSCLHWFNNANNVFYVAIGADGAPFGKEDSATAYLVSFLNLLQGVQSCNNNHLLLGADCGEDHPLMTSYTKQLSKEMEEMEEQALTTERGHKVIFKFELVPADMKWVALMSGELNNAVSYFSSFANVSNVIKNTMGGSIGTCKATWQPWNYEVRLKMAYKVDKFKKTLKDPNGKQRGKVTAFIANNKSRQESSPAIGKYVDSFKAEPLHCTNNAWQSWFMFALAIAMQYTGEGLLKSAQSLSDLPSLSAVAKFMACVRNTVKCGRLFKNFSRWFGEKRKSGLAYCYRFTGLESKKFAWNFASLVQELLSIDGISSQIEVKIHALAFVALHLRDAVAIYTRVSLDAELLEELTTKCKYYFNANSLFLGKGVSPTIWTIGYAILHHTRQLFESMGFGLGLNSMQGREAKHIKLARYIQNTCNVKKEQRWWIVFRHEFISLVWLRELDPFSISYRSEGENNLKRTYIPTWVTRTPADYCHCGLKKLREKNKCAICDSTIMQLILQSVIEQKVASGLRKVL